VPSWQAADPCCCAAVRSAGWTNKDGLPGRSYSRQAGKQEQVIDEYPVTCDRLFCAYHVPHSAFLRRTQRPWTPQEVVRILLP
jgi:hypothetical protein